MKILVIDHIRSIHNVGCMFRTADGAGFDEIIICGYSPQPTDSRMSKVALGAEQTVSWRHEVDTLVACQKLKQQGYELIALEATENSADIFNSKAKSNKAALIVGHEKDGVQLEVLEICDQIWQIPMRGDKESLNVSVAAGIGMYHLAEQL